MSALLRAVFVIGLCAVVVVAGALLIPACGLRTPALVSWLGVCPAPETLARQDRLAIAAAEADQLQREIAFLERELAAIPCTAIHPVEDVPDPDPPAEQARIPEPTEPEIDSRKWERRDIGVLNGCWELDSNYSARHIRTGEVTHFNQWTMCFDTDGSGTEEMRATNGTRCQGNVGAEFDGGGSLVISEPGNLACDDRTFIYRRVTSCRLNARGVARCQVNQPELGRTSSVRLRRSNEGR